MSPEQVRRERLSGQTDLFSAGVLMWEMLVGERLFARSEAEATLAAVLDEDIPRPSSRREGIPERLDEVVMRALERDTSARWASAGEMLAALQKFLYALENTPGPQEAAALVSRYCPPETRRMPTHAEPMSPDLPVASGPSTAVIPRDSVAARGRPKRAQTFATHVELEHMLGAPTPEASPGPVTKPTAERARSAQPVETAEDRRGVIAPKLSLGDGSPPSRATLILVGGGAIALAIAAIVVFYRGRDQVLHSDARVVPPLLADAAPPDAAAPPDTAPPIDAAPPPDAVQADGPARTRIDAPPARPSIDAPPATPSPDATVGTATLRIGADPWGEIAIDGVAKGHTPKELTVSAGHHTIEVSYPAESPPRKQTFSVDLSAGDTKQIQADFK
jgi:serine/threonine-protein kinase